MARPTIRTAVLSGELRITLRKLFGTTTNAYANLRLTTKQCQYPLFVRALAGKTVIPEAAYAIEHSWLTWQSLWTERVEKDLSKSKGA